MARRSHCLVLSGWFVAFAIYLVQACFLMKFLEQHTEKSSNLYWIGVGFYLALAVAVLIMLRKTDGFANSDDELCYIWVFWFFYILLFTISVAILFAKVADKLEETETYGPNFLKSILAITPALLVLILQLVIDPKYRKEILTMSVVAALNIFDGIEMLEIVLMQNEREDFNLDGDTERAVIAFACLSFITTSLGLARIKLHNDHHILMSNVALTLVEIICTNVPFFVLRVVVWNKYGYEASIFMAKNIVALAVGFVEFGISCDCCTCA